MSTSENELGQAERSVAGPATIPELSESGSSETQTKSSGDVLPPAAKPPYEPSPLASVTGGLAEAPPSRLGAKAAVDLLHAWTLKYDQEVGDLKAQLSKEREKNDILIQQNAKLQTENAVFSEKILSINSEKTFRSFGIFIGTLIFSVGATISVEEINKISILLIVVGCMLLAFSYFYNRKGV